MSNFRAVRVSKFRHVYGQTARREHSYEGIRISGSAHDSQLCAVNPKFIAVVLEVAGGGAFQVLPLKWMGKVDYHTGRISGHSGVVNDLKWDPFNDNVIASCSDDSKVKLWYIPDGGVRMYISHWLCEFAGHCRRVVYVEWHPTVEGVLASAAADCRVCLWNVSRNECFLVIDHHDDLVYSMAFNTNGTFLATTCKDRFLRIFDARTGSIMQESLCHEGVKTSKVVFLDKKKLLTTGFNRMSHRQIAIWDQDDLSSPLLIHEVDTSPGVLFPLYDPDLNILYIAGKGDGNIRYYEILDERPYLSFLSEFHSKYPQRGITSMPKRGLDVLRCEIFRLYKIHASQLLVEPVSFIVPRKSERFQTDIFPPTAGPTPALTLDEWMCGLDKEPVLISLETNALVTTNKPVQIKMAFDSNDDGEDNAEQQRPRATLIKSDRNNDLKFQFLAEVTKPDYRDITEREDYPDLIKVMQIKQNYHNNHNRRRSHENPLPKKTASSAQVEQSPVVPTGRKISSRQHRASLAEAENFGDDNEEFEEIVDEKPQCKSVTKKKSAFSDDEEAISDDSENDYDEHAITSNRQRTPATVFSARDDESSATPSVIVGNSTPKCPSIVTPVSLRSSKPPLGPGVQPSSGIVSKALAAATALRRRRSQSSSTASSSSNNTTASSSPVSSFVFGASGGALAPPTALHPAAGGTTPTSVTSCPVGANGRPSPVGASPMPFRSPQSLTEKRTFTKPGCIAPGPMVHRESTTHVVRPCRASQSQPPTPRTSITQVDASSTNALNRPHPEDLAQSGGTTCKESEIQKLYTQQSRRLREMLAELEPKNARIDQLERDLASLTVKVESLQQELVLKNEDVDSLRYEIAWKNKRISQLEKQLYSKGDDQSS